MRLIPVGLIFIFVVALPVLGQAPVVTATQWVNVGSKDNRLVYPPSQGGMIAFWEVSSKPGVVEALFGPPNRRFPMRSARGGKWYYQGAYGAILDLWFLGDDELGEAKYVLPNNTERPVGSIERELAGMGREEVVGKLGEPTYKSAITGGNGFIETYSYFVDESTQVSIQLLNGKVTRVR